MIDRYSSRATDDPIEEKPEHGWEGCPEHQADGTIDRPELKEHQSSVQKSALVEIGVKTLLKAIQHQNMVFKMRRIPRILFPAESLSPSWTCSS
jgi:hypothetical protein